MIRRFRALDMSLDDIQAVLSAPDLRTRDHLIAAHLARMEAGLARTQRAVAALRDLLEHAGAPTAVGHRRADATPAAAISEEIGIADALQRYQGALGELRATLATHVAEHEVAVDGPLREYYLVGPGDTAEQGAWRTEIGWPVFATGSTG